MKGVLITVSVSNGVEFICYLILFWEMYKHHKKHVKLCLSNKPHLAKKKKRQNIISTVGHFASWLTEITLFGLLHCLVFGKYYTENSSYNIFFFRLFVPSINYIVFPSVQAIASQDLREHVFSLDSFKGKCLKCGNNIEDNSPEEIELQVLPNGNVHNHM